MTWTHFWDMGSGGSDKEKWHDIYIEAGEDEACIIFYNRFGHNPNRVTCTCCGEDYSISSKDDIAQLTGWHRGCRNIETPRQKNGLYKKIPDDVKYYLEEGEDAPDGYTVKEEGYRFKEYQTLDEYMADDNTHFIFEKDIKPGERSGTLPDQGYVWVD